MIRKIRAQWANSRLRACWFWWHFSVQSDWLSRTSSSWWPSFPHPPIRQASSANIHIEGSLFSPNPTGLLYFNEDWFGFFPVNRVSSMFNAATTSGRVFTQAMDLPVFAIPFSFWKPKSLSASVLLNISTMAWSQWISVRPRRMTVLWSATFRANSKDRYDRLSRKLLRLHLSIKGSASLKWRPHRQR